MSDASEAGAASVASQLLAFWREPVRHRPGYIHGQVALPEGQVVLKFALGRFSHVWHGHVSDLERKELHAAANAFVRQVCLWERATHYQVLCTQPEADAEALKENHRLLMALLHPDRQDRAAQDWPTDCAQRVNRAYTTLSDDQARAAYDAGLAVAEVHAATAAMAGGYVAPGERHRGRRRADLQGRARGALLVTGVIAALFVFHAVWVRDLPREHSLLAGALRVDAPARWVREALPNVGLPRFIESSVATVFAPAFTPQPLERLKEPRPMLAMRVAEAMPVAPATPAATPAPAAPPPTEASATIAPTEPPIPRAPSPAPSRASADTAAPVPAFLRMAQAVAPPTSVAGAPSPEQIEILVALLVSYYDAGDAVRLVALIDPDSLGLWKGYRTRNAYTDFFRATKQRRLRVERLAWRIVPPGALAKGEATVIAEYHDTTSRLERRVELELDIALREGAARITRLSLYPDGP